MKEQWVPTKYHSEYLVSNLGRVKRKERILKPGKGRGGYHIVCLCFAGHKKMMKVHRLVAEHFLINNKNLPQVNHIDGDRTNNIISNLEWVSNQQNKTHEVTHLNKKERGVYWHKKDKKWIAKIVYQKKKMYLGYYNTREEGLDAYKNKFKELYNKEPW